MSDFKTPELRDTSQELQELRATLAKIKSLMDCESSVILELDDVPATDGLHLRDYQRLPLLEEVWAQFKEIKKLVGDAA